MISIVTSCMNRNDILDITIESWLEFSLVSEIIIVDWSSNIPVYDTISRYYDNPKLKVLRIEDQQEFNLSKSLNVGFDFTNKNNKLLCKIDVDYLLVNNNIFYDLLNANTWNGSCLTKNIFFTGHWMFDISLSGFLLMNKDQFLYYNENMSGWGYEDSDLYMRLQNRGLDRIVIPGLKKYVAHLPHNDKLRTENYSIKDKTISAEQNRSKQDIHYKRSSKVYDTTNINQKYIIINHYE